MRKKKIHCKKNVFFKCDSLAFMHDTIRRSKHYNTQCDLCTI